VCAWNVWYRVGVCMECECVHEMFGSLLSRERVAGAVINQRLEMTTRGEKETGKRAREEEEQPVDGPVTVFKLDKEYGAIAGRFDEDWGIKRFKVDVQQGGPVPFKYLIFGEHCDTFNEYSEACERYYTEDMERLLFSTKGLIEMVNDQQALLTQYKTMFDKLVVVVKQPPH